MAPRIEELFSGFDRIIGWLVPMGVIVSLVFIIMGGYMWMTSAGNPDKIRQAKGTLTWAILGLILILLAGLLISTLIDYFV